jgi:pteridine reductase
MSSSPVALITGSVKRRVGFVIAEHLARAGYHIALHYNSSSAEVPAALKHFAQWKVNVTAHGAELGHEPAVHTLVSEVWKAHGRIDVLVNAAAIWSSKKLEDVIAADVIKNFEANTLGTFLISQQVGLQMVKQQTGGNIITIGDWACERPYQHYAAYFPSKGAIPALTRTLAVELGSRNPKVRVNCILPGPVMLPPDLPQAEKDEAINATLVKREGSPDHIAHAVKFLIENDFVNGVCLPVDGGRTIYAP